MKGRAALGLLLSAPVLLAAAPAALAALSVTRAELSGGQLRLEGQGATPNATITLDGVAMGHGRLGRPLPDRALRLQLADVR